MKNVSLNDLPKEKIEKWQKQHPSRTYGLNSTLQFIEDKYREAQFLKVKYDGLPKPYVCPKCKQELAVDKLNFLKRKGRKNKLPWCIKCNTRMYRSNHPAVKNPVKILKNKYPVGLEMKNI